MAEWGEYEESLLKRYEQTGHMAASLERKPNLLPENADLVHAFFSLCRHRQQAFSGINPLLLQDVMLYAIMVGFSDIEWFHDQIMKCDVVWRGIVSKKQQPKSNGKVHRG